MMLLRLVRVAMVLLVGATLLFMPDTEVSQAAEGATVIRQFFCGITPEASGLPIFLLTVEKTHSVVTPSGNTLLSCRFDIPPEFRPDQTMRHRNFLCNTFLGLTTTSMSVTTQGGKVHLTCLIHGRN